MEYLFNLGFNENEIKNIITTNNEVMNLSDEEIKSLVEKLVNIGCKDYHIKNIISANPYYLSRSTTDVNNLISKLSSLGITNLETTFDSNPWLLNKDAYEIDEYIIDEQSKGLSIDEIIDNIDSGMIGD